MTDLSGGARLGVMQAEKSAAQGDRATENSSSSPAAPEAAMQRGGKARRRSRTGARSGDLESQRGGWWTRAEAPPISPYKILNVDPSASQSELQAAFRAFARQTHPDTKPNDDEAATRFAFGRRAYEFLRNIRNRELYDRGVLHFDPLGDDGADASSGSKGSGSTGRAVDATDETGKGVEECVGYGLAQMALSASLLRLQADLLGDFSREDDRSLNERANDSIRLSPAEVAEEAGLAEVWDPEWGPRTLLQLAAVRRIFETPTDPWLTNMCDMASRGRFGAEYFVRVCREMVRADASLPRPFVDALEPWPGAERWRALSAGYAPQLKAALYAEKGERRKRNSAALYRAGGRMLAPPPALGLEGSAPAPDSALLPRGPSDPAHWSADTVNKTALTLRLPYMLVQVAKRAAAARGETLSQFIRDSLAVGAVDQDRIVNRHGILGSETTDVTDRASQLVASADVTGAPDPKEVESQEVEPEEVVTQVAPAEDGWASAVVADLGSGVGSRTTRVAMSRSWRPGPEVTHDDVVAALGAHLLHEGVLDGDFARLSLDIFGELTRGMQGLGSRRSNGPLEEETRIRITIPSFVFSRLPLQRWPTAAQTVRAIWAEYEAGAYDQALGRNGFRRGRHLAALVSIFEVARSERVRTFVEPGLVEAFGGAHAQHHRASCHTGSGSRRQVHEQNVRQEDIISAVAGSVTVMRLVAHGHLRPSFVRRRAISAVERSDPGVRVKFSDLARMTAQQQRPPERLSASTSSSNRGTHPALRGRTSSLASVAAQLSPRLQILISQYMSSISSVCQSSIWVPSDGGGSDTVFMIVSEGGFLSTKSLDQRLESRVQIRLEHALGPMVDRAPPGNGIRETIMRASRLVGELSSAAAGFSLAVSVVATDCRIRVVLERQSRDSGRGRMNARDDIHSGLGAL